MYLFIFYAPETHVESIKEAVFNAGAGHIGHYAHCAWQTKGQGQFMPLKGSDAFIGDMNRLEKVPEYKVEMVCDEIHIQAVIAALKSAHPYETPAYHIVRCEPY